MPDDEHEGKARAAADPSITDPPAADPPAVNRSAVDPSTGARQRHSEAAFDVAPELLVGPDDAASPGADPGEPTTDPGGPTAN